MGLLVGAQMGTGWRAQSEGSEIEDGGGTRKPSKTFEETVPWASAHLSLYVLLQLFNWCN